MGRKNETLDGDEEELSKRDDVATAWQLAISKTKLKTTLETFNDLNNKLKAS